MQKMRHGWLRSRTEPFLNRVKAIPTVTILTIVLSSQLGAQSSYAYVQQPVQYVNNVKQDSKGSIDIASKELDPERVQELKELYDLDSEPPINHGITGDFGFSISENSTPYTLIKHLLKLLLNIIKTL
ncbi:hypothetical protein NQ117_15030 [Paenibacillus sp. SC116]|uniref:hypothetical protein n=1 Tax=Paenibacillus sp. SC116 TaxID=2968986 RepID=UPI00215AF4FA|nr:hypothetical protein [Paenibacillus sp. SC116]MCR8844994.1 hypothetical protein [Paenibacillus sp. SC116]